MNVAVVKKLVETHPIGVIQDAIQKFENTLENPLQVEGQDDGEKLSHLLVAEIVLQEMAKGLSFHEALRTYSQRVRSMITAPKK